MSNTSHRSVIVAAASAFLLVNFLYVAPAQAMQCVNLSADAGSGMHDPASGGPVFLLQQYLISAGYLSATPNGYFGPATLAAVKAFQTAHGLPSTGYAGPLSRAAIGQATCGANPTSAAPNGQTVQPAVSPASNLDFVAPAPGQVITTGQTFNIQWNSQPYQRYDLILVSSTGSGVGFIAQSLVNVNRYVWNVGSVYSSQTQSNITVPPGTYQIRIQSSVNGSQASDKVSAQFTIQTATLNIASVFPASVPADGRTAAVIYGSNFDSTAIVNLASGSKAQTLYVSPDRSVLVFQIPTGSFTGPQTVSVSNQSGVTSNQLSFTVMAP